MKVFIQQPVIPSYRVPLFNALAACDDLELEVHASLKIPGLPATADKNLFQFKFVEHECKTKRDRRYFNKIQKNNCYWLVSG